MFTVNIDGNQTMGMISECSFVLSQLNKQILTMKLKGSEFHNEKTVIFIEIYRKSGVWRFAGIARGFNGGLSDLLKSYGGKEIKPENKPIDNKYEKKIVNEKPTPIISPAPEPIKRPKIELRKGQKVNLEKTGKNLGEILINLNWSQPKKRLYSWLNAIDLDLGCLYEMKDGSKGCVQALGNSFGRLDAYPFISLDGDDRTGAVTAGENLRINGKYISEMKRILIYTFIYEGIANWKQADGIVTIKCPGSSELIVKMDEYGTNQKMCAIAMFENINNETFAVEKLIRFFNGHPDMDKAFKWNMKWVYGRK